MKFANLNKKWVWRGLLLIIIIAIMGVSVIISGTMASYNDPETSSSNVVRTINNWYNLAWHWRRPITIHNSGSALSNYEFRMTIDTASLVDTGRMLSNGNDIRFTASDGTTNLPYWIESDMDSGSTVIWVNTPSLPTGDTVIYLYYGNTSAAAASNGDDVFIFFDDFESGTENWTKSGSGTMSTVTSQEYHGSRSLRLQNKVTAYAMFTAQSRCVIEYAARVAQTNRIWQMSMENSSGTSGPLLRFSNSGSAIQYSDNSWKNTGQTYNTSTWYAFKLNDVNCSGDDYDIVINGTNRVNGADFENGVASISQIEISSSSNSSTIYIDLVKVRQYSATEPTVTVYGEEE